jgi:predicted phosphodiesterase
MKILLHRTIATFSFTVGSVLLLAFVAFAQPAPATFAKPIASYKAGINPDAVAVGDFNNDGIMDLAVVNLFNAPKKSQHGTVSILLGNGSSGVGDGTFCNPPLCTPPTFDVGVRPVAIAVGDFNNDGNLDLVVANFGNPDLKKKAEDGDISILRGNGDGTFQTAQTFAVADSNPTKPIGPLFVAVADLDGDGDLDLAVTIRDATSSTSDSVSILLNSGTGTFPTHQLYPVGRDPVSLVVANLNSNTDSIPDLAVVNFLSKTVSILLGNGDGTFDDPGLTPLPPLNPAPITTGTQPISIVAGNFDSDSIVDLVVANFGDRNVSFFKGHGDGQFDPATNSPSLAKNPIQAVAGDFNGDGTLDVVTANAAKSISVVLGEVDGLGVFDFAKPPQSETVAGGQFAVVSGDFNGDTKPDLAVVAGGKVYVLLSTP